MIVDFRLRVFFLKFKRYKEWFYNLGKLVIYMIKLCVIKFKKIFYLNFFCMLYKLIFVLIFKNRCGVKIVF